MAGIFVANPGVRYSTDNPVNTSGSPSPGEETSVARSDHDHGVAGAAFGAPALTFGTTNVEGTGNAVRTGATIAVFDATNPASAGGAAAPGVAAFAARRDHVHAVDASHAGSAHHTQGHAVDSGSDHSAGTLGDLIYAAAAGAWARLTGNTTTTRKFLRQTGDGAASAAPAWDTLVDGDVPATHSGSAHHAAVTIGADGEHSLAGQVISGVDAAAAQKGHIQLAGELGGTAASPTVAATHSGSAHHTRAHAMDGSSDHSAGTLGGMIYAGVAGAITWLAGNSTTTKKFLRQTGTGAASAAPAWDTLVDGDIPTTLTAVTNHEAAADPHTGYRLESADHTHASSGAQAGQVAHSALSGITATDHHSNANDHARSHDHSAAGDGTALAPATLTVPGAITPAQTAEGSAVWDTDNDVLTVGDGTGRKTLLDKDTLTAKGDIYVATAAGAVSRLAVGATNGHVLTVDSAEATGLKWAAAAAAGGIPTSMILSTAFEATARFTNTLTGSGIVQYANEGLVQATSATATSGVRTTKDSNLTDITAGSPTWSCHAYVNTLGSDLNTFCGIGPQLAATGGAIVYTVQHVGFKILRSASGTASLYATQADGTTETASAAIDTITAAGNQLDLILEVNSTTSVDYYYRHNSGALSAATNLATNMPGPVSSGVDQFLISNVGVASASTMKYGGATYQR